MGNYLTTPNAVKDTQNGGNERMRYGTCAMQGWRVTMEDAHLVYVFDHAVEGGNPSQNSGQPIALFGVYDGHGGPQVSQFVVRHLVEELMKTPDFRKGRFDGAFRATYIILDQLLAQPQSQAELELLLHHNTHGTATRSPSMTLVAGSAEGTTDACIAGNPLVGNAAGIGCLNPSIATVPSAEMDLSSSKDVVEKAEAVPDCTKGRGFRSSVKLGGKKLYHRVGNHRRKNSLRNNTGAANNLTMLSSFEAVDVSEEHRPYASQPAPSPGPAATSRTARLRRRRESAPPKEPAVSGSNDYSSSNRDSINPVSLVSDAASSFTTNHVQLRPSPEAREAQNGTNSVLPDGARSPRPVGGPTSFGHDNSRVRSDTAGGRWDTSTSSCHTSRASQSLSVEPSSSDALAPSNVTTGVAGGLFSFQGFKSLLSTVMRMGSTVGRHGTTTQGSLAMLAGCTALSVLMTNTQIVVANTGDSRCVLCRGDVAVELSKDHKPGLAEERSRIYAAGGWLEMGRVNGNLNLSRAIGDLVYKSNSSLPPERQVVSGVPDVVIVDITEHDKFLVIGCDGIWESSTSQEIVNFIRDRIDTMETLGEVLEALFEELLSPNPTLFEFGCDNMTAILVDLQPQRRAGASCKDVSARRLLQSPRRSTDATIKTVPAELSVSGTRAHKEEATVPNKFMDRDGRKDVWQSAHSKTSEKTDVSGGFPPDHGTFWEAQNGSPYAPARPVGLVRESGDRKPNVYETWERVVANAAASGASPATVAAVHQDNGAVTVESKKHIRRRETPKASAPFVSRSARNVKREPQPSNNRPAQSQEATSPASSARGAVSKKNPSRSTRN